ncbi:hypothetical protein ACQCX2_01450 [Propionibacteriaceae bacterium Y1700]|uniref:hypothetical protein n=1 Tax=Microlunatus sp. Y1700 TaxID=3418487 RepID=UPI003DA70A0A
MSLTDEVPGEGAPTGPAGPDQRWIRRSYADLFGSDSGPLGHRITRSGAELWVAADLVIKVHAHRTDPEQLARQLAAVEVAPEVWVPPQRVEVQLSPDGRAITAWPRVHVLDHDSLSHEEAPPWGEARSLLERWHALSADHPPMGDLPGHDPAVRLGRARERLRATPYDSSLGAVGDRLLAELADRDEDVRQPVHGDWHLGQLGQTRDGWRLLDVDDVALGDPVWDLARPAGWWAAGLISDEDWSAFGGREVAWASVDLPARCAVFLTASRVADPATEAVDAPETAVCAEICLQW